MNFLAYAEKADESGSGIVLPMVIVAVVVGVILLAGIVCIVAMKRRHGRLGIVVGCSVMWAMLTAGSVSWSVVQRADWDKEHTLRLQTGYLEGTDESGRPAWPVGLWIGLGAGYAGLWVFAMNK